VVFDHLSYQVLLPVRTVVTAWIDPGEYGVFVFFLVSGFIVPASLERRGSVRSFWVSRLFRLYPFYLLALVLLALLTVAHLGTLRGMAQEPGTSALGQLLMMSDVLSTPDVPYTVWTLAYEMVFYLLITLLFTLGLHRRSGTFAIVFAVAALGVGGRLPASAFSASFFGPTPIALAADVLILGGVAAAVAWRGSPRLVGAGLAALTGLALITFNGSSAHYPWEAFTILALMFAGTVLYRAEQGQLGRGQAAAITLSVLTLTLAGGLWHLHAAGDPMVLERKWLITLLLAGLTFAVGLAVRRRTIPAFLAWLGLVSYSVYLLHPVLLGIYWHLGWSHRPHSIPVQLAVTAAFLAVLLGSCWLTYRFVEAPAQRLGKRVATKLDARFGPDRVTAAAPTPAPAST
jgi:peptidoglycan/LPS O-acetylase OafA/YrhL